MRRFSSFFVAGLSVVSAAALAQACGGSSDSTTDLFNGDGGGDTDGGVRVDGSNPHDGSTGHDGGDSDGGGRDSGADTGTCTGLECNVAHCDAGRTTTLKGTITDPAKLNPIYAATVYVPNKTPDAMPTGLSCDRCGAKPSGQPITIALTAADGTFELKGVPNGAKVPLVIQIGRWRRQVEIPNVDACTENKITDKDLTRLPKNSTEGDIPLMAITTGGCDPFECLLRKIGIDDAEFTAPSGTGRVHMYQGQGGATPAGGGAVSASTLWSSASRLASYSAVLNACECDTFVADKPPTSQQNMLDYVNAGGRWLGSHFHYSWLANGPAPLPATASFITPEDLGDNMLAANVDTSFPKGSAFADWLVTTGASTTRGQLSISEIRFDATIANLPSRTWLKGTNTQTTKPALAQFSFTTPYQPTVSVGDAGLFDAGNAAVCGKVAYTDYHESLSTSGGVFPAECVAGAMTAQEKALEFMLFDLTSCVQDDTQAPTVPPLR